MKSLNSSCEISISSKAVDQPTNQHCHQYNHAAKTAKNKTPSAEEVCGIRSKAPDQKPSGPCGEIGQLCICDLVLFYFIYFLLFVMSEAGRY